jgi:Transposase IS4
LVAGVCRKGGRGFPKLVLQEEVKNRNEQLKVRGTLKAAVLKGDDDCVNLVAVSVYNTKLVQFLSMSCESNEWITKERKVFSSNTGQYEKLKFLRFNINDNYHKEMGHVDISDQLRNYYRFDHYMRKRKWWWSLAFSGIGVQFVNAYVVYCKVMEAHGVTKKDWFAL